MSGDDARKATGQPRSPGRRAVDKSEAETRLPIATGSAKDAPKDDDTASPTRASPPRCWAKAISAA